LQGSNPGKGERFFSSPNIHPPLYGPLSLPSNEYLGPFPEIKRSGRETDHSNPSSAEVKNEWSYTSISLHASLA